MHYIPRDNKDWYWFILLCRVAWCTSSTKYMSVGVNFASQSFLGLLTMLLLWLCLWYFWVEENSIINPRHATARREKDFDLWSFCLTHTQIYFARNILSLTIRGRKWGIAPYKQFIVMALSNSWNICHYTYFSNLHSHHSCGI